MFENSIAGGGLRSNILNLKIVYNFFEIHPLLDAARRLRDAEQNRRREELQRRIEETRMKLQNVSIFYLDSMIYLSNDHPLPCPFTLETRLRLGGWTEQVAIPNDIPIFWTPCPGLTAQFHQNTFSSHNKLNIILIKLDLTNSASFIWTNLFD